MTDHVIDKPKLFISHAASDADFATALKQEIGKVFANGVEVFSSSSPGAIPVGTDWLADVEAQLKSAQTVIVLITPTSIERGWVWFELGATWAAGRQGHVKIYPLCVAEIDLSNLPSPLDRLQALSLGRATDLKLLFEALIAQFGFGSIKSFRASNITGRIPKYKNVEVKPVDATYRRLYSGKYSGYSDKELSEVIATEFFEPDEQNYGKYATLYQKREDLIHNGKLIHYRQVDSRLELPPGTAFRLLIPVAAQYGLEPEQQSDNVVRFRVSKKRHGY